MSLEFFPKSRKKEIHEMDVPTPKTNLRRRLIAIVPALFLACGGTSPSTENSKISDGGAIDSEFINVIDVTIDTRNPATPDYAKDSTEQLIHEGFRPGHSTTDGGCPEDGGCEEDPFQNVPPDVWNNGG